MLKPKYQLMDKPIPRYRVYTCYYYLRVAKFQEHRVPDADYPYLDKNYREDRYNNRKLELIRNDHHHMYQRDKKSRNPNELDNTNQDHKLMRNRLNPRDNKIQGDT